LTEAEIDQLWAFLFTLTDVRFAAENQRQLERQQAVAKKDRPFRDNALALRRTLPFEQRVAGGKSTP
jgi:cytochrome c peroxidase